MTPQELKKSILQLAIQGKLVEQRPEEGTAEVLYRQIQEEKKRLVNEGKIKKEKPLAEITEDEALFDIPESWKWVKLGEIASVFGGKRIPAGRKLTTENTGYKYIRVSDMKNGSVLMDGLLYVPQDIYPFISRYCIYKEDIYITVAGTIGRVGKIPPEIDGANLTENADRLVFSSINQDWLIKCLESSVIQTQIINVTTKVGQPKLAIKRIQELVLPLPSLAEQKRIVAKIEELLPYIDRYEQAWSKLEDFNKRFPIDMQKSILQTAIQGKLVEQRPEEGTGEELYQQIQAEKQRLVREGKIKKEKPFSTSTSYQEYPFDIPDSWRFVRFGELMISRDSERIPVSTAERSRRAKIYDYYGASGVIDKIDNYLFDKELLLIGEDGANLLSRSTPIAFLAQGKYWVNNHAHVLDGCCGLNLKYICYFINAISLAPYVTGTAQPKMNQENMNAIWVALPPLAEQKRIVAKLEQLLPLCERLK